MIDWKQPYTATCRLVKVNQETWASGIEVPYVVSASVNRDCTDDYSLLESASLQLEADSEDFDPGWYRLECLFEQNASMARYPIMTMLCESSTGNRDKGRITLNVDGLSVLQPASERHMIAGSYLPKGTNGATKVRDFLTQCTPAPVEVEGNFTLDDDLILDADSSYLRAAWQVLQAAEWCMQITADGTIVVREKPMEPELTLDKVNASMLKPAMEFSRDMDEVINMYIVVEGSARAEAVNDSPSSSISTVTRGRIVDEIDRNPIRVNGESLEYYARRKLEEKSTIVKSYGYTRGWYPGIYPYTMVRGSLAEHGLVDDMRVLSQSLTIGKGIEVAETAGILIKEYTA